MAIFALSIQSQRPAAPFVAGVRQPQPQKIILISATMFKQAWTRLQAITLLASCGSAGLQDVNGGEAVAAPRQAPKPTKPNKSEL